VTLSTSAPKKLAGRELLPLLLVLVGIAVFYASTMRPGDSWCGDCAQYLQHARNISDRAPYGRISFVFHEDGWNPGPRVYPPIFPLLLAPFYHTFGLELKPMKFLVLVFFVGSLVLIYFAFRSELGALAGLGLIAIIGFNPYFWDLKDYVLSDIPFLFLCYLALFLTQEASSRENSGRPFLAFSALAGLVMYAACGTRSIGVVMIPAALVWSVVRHARITKPIAIITSICTALVLGEAVELHTVQGYAKAHALAYQPTTLSSISHQLLEFIHYYLGSLSSLWSNGHNSGLRLTFFFFTFVMMLIGLSTQSLRNLRVYDVFALFYLPVVLYSWMEMRYLIPLVPLYLFYALRGVLWLIQRAPRRFGVVISSALVSVVALIYTADYHTLDLHQFAFSTIQPEAQQLLTFIKTQTTQDDVIEFFAPRTLSLYTGRRSSQHSLVPTRTDLSCYLGRVGITYVVTSPLVEDRALSDFVWSNRDCWSQPFSNSMFDVYRVPGSDRRTRIPDAR
jgi:hypothetical protein